MAHWLSWKRDFKMTFRWGAPGGRETTRVSSESEVRIPLQVYFWMGIVGDIMIVGVTLITWCVQIYTALSRGLGLDGWYKWWWGRFSVRWPLHIALLIGWPISVPALLLLIKFALEQIDKHYPAPARAESRANGPMGPFFGLRPFFRVLFSRNKIRARYDELFRQDET